MFKRAIFTSLMGLSLSLSTLAQNHEAPSQTSVLVRHLPRAIVQLPMEGMYRLNRRLELDQWSRLRNRPEVQNLLSVVQAGRYPHPEYTFPFENWDEDFEGIVEREFGVCSGFATLQRNFNLLMHFDPSNGHGAKVPRRSDRQAYYDYYFRLIDRVVRLRPVIIPGFKNLAHFMRDPEIQRYTKQRIVDAWAKNNATLQGIEQLINHRKQLPQSRWARLHQELSARLNAGYNPLIYASFPATESSPKNIHVIQVMGIGELDPKTSAFDLFIWDDGVIHDIYGPFAPHKLVKVISFKPNGDMLWLESPAYRRLRLDNKQSPLYRRMKREERLDETFWVGLLPNDDAVMAQLVTNKFNWCMSNPQFMRYCY
jgi:hypothetical protein